VGDAWVGAAESDFDGEAAGAWLSTFGGGVQTSTWRAHGACSTVSVGDGSFALSFSSRLTSFSILFLSLSVRGAPWVEATALLELQPMVCLRLVSRKERKKSGNKVA